MTKPVVDFFFSPYATAQEQRLQAALADGIAHGSRIMPHDPLPDTPVTLLFSVSLAVPIEDIAVYYTTDGLEPVGERGRATHGLVVMARADAVTIETDIAVRQWHAQLPAQHTGTLVRYRVDGWNNEGGYWQADNVEPVSVPPLHGRVFAYHVDHWAAPQWWYDAVVYHIFVDRFNAGTGEPRLLDHDQREITDFFGGTLQGIIEKLDYIQALGANCIWLSPIFESATHHGYNASDYYTVAQRYGTNETLRQLTHAAHQRGMHVLFDFVANHTSDKHAAFIDALAHPTGPMAQWYAIGDTVPNGYRSYASVGDMPELRTDHPAVQRYLFEAANYWLSNLGADGLRLDYMPGPSHAFWTLFQQAIKTSTPNALTLGEITGPMDEIANYAGRVDAFMDFPLTRLLRQTFALRSLPLTTLLAQLDEHHAPIGMSGATLLDNHDMHRFLWLADGKIERLKLAAVCHMTLAGTPIVYYGTEVGLSQYGDAHRENAYARAPMLWDERQDTALLALYRQIIALRITHTALRYGARINIELDVPGATDANNRAQVGGYMRVLGQSYLLVFLNNNEQQLTVRLSLAKALKQAGIENVPGGLQTLFSTDQHQEFRINDGYVELSLAAFGGVVVGTAITL